MDNPMHQPKLNIKPTHSILPASTSASISHTTDAQFQTPKQNPPTGSQPTISPMTNNHQQSANIATQQSPDCKGTHSCNNAEPSSLTQMAITHIQNYPMPYLCAYRTRAFATCMIPSFLLHQSVQLCKLCIFSCKNIVNKLHFYLSFLNVPVNFLQKIQGQGK